MTIFLTTTGIKILLLNFFPDHFYLLLDCSDICFCNGDGNFFKSFFFILNFKKLKDCIHYVKERNLSIGFGDKIDRKKFFEDLFKDSNFIDHDVEVYISKEEEIPIINVVTDIYREIHNSFKYIQKTYYIKPVKYIFERVKIRSHQKFLKKNKRRKVTKSPKLNKLISKLKL